ncbi:GNAT family N-acetyltransferase [Streptomyces sp. NPDC127036]|uniref:GNAT family N-acetyltransferase n=1 Tax=Streptomyces sp. NPDC127036 TaxID=3347112 RepID=UPI0036697B7C
MPTVSVREYAGPDAMDVLALQWRELYAEDSAASPFQSPAWLTAWACHRPHTATPIVLAATSPTGRWLAALALVRHDDGDSTRILPLSAPHAECVLPVGPYADDTCVAQALAFHLLLADDAGADVVMTDVPATSALGTTLTLLCEDTGWDCTTTPNAAIQLPVRYDRLSASTAREHQRRRRTWTRLAAAGRTITYTRTRHTADLLAAFDVLGDLHERRWAGHEPLPGSLTAGDRAPWRAVLAELGAAHACIATLAVDDHVVAAQLLLTRGPRCYSLIPAMDPAHRHLAPGHALLRHLTEDLAGEGFHVLDLGRTIGAQQAYKQQYRPAWTSTVSALSAPLGAAA